MTARVMLPTEDLDGPNDEWFSDLLAFDVSPTAGWVITARIKALILLVRLYADGARHSGATAWPTPATLTTLLGFSPDHVLHLITIATAAGFLVYADDAPPLLLCQQPPDAATAAPQARTSGRPANSKRPPAASTSAARRSRTYPPAGGIDGSKHDRGRSSPAVSASAAGGSRARPTSPTGDQ
jgi:hypothetical protein